MFNQKIVVSDEVLAQEVSGEMVLLDLKSEQYLGLNEVGTRIWQLLQEHSDLDNVFKILLDEYDVEEALLKSDLNKLINDMEEAGIVAVIEKESLEQG